MHVFRVQTRVKHTMRLEKAGVVFFVVAGTGDSGRVNLPRLQQK